jgi:hypothetical protein
VIICRNSKIFGFGFQGFEKIVWIKIKLKDEVFMMMMM